MSTTKHSKSTTLGERGKHPKQAMQKAFENGYRVHEAIADGNMSRWTVEPVTLGTTGPRFVRLDYNPGGFYTAEYCVGVGGVGNSVAYQHWCVGVGDFVAYQHWGTKPIAALISAAGLVCAVDFADAKTGQYVETCALGHYKGTLAWLQLTLAKPLSETFDS